MTVNIVCGKDRRAVDEEKMIQESAAQHECDTSINPLKPEDCTSPWSRVGGAGARRRDPRRSTVWPRPAPCRMRGRLELERGVAAWQANGSGASAEIDVRGSRVFGTAAQTLHLPRPPTDEPSPCLRARSCPRFLAAGVGCQSGAVARRDGPSRGRRRAGGGRGAGGVAGRAA